MPTTETLTVVTAEEGSTILVLEVEELAFEKSSVNVHNGDRHPN